MNFRRLILRNLWHFRRSYLAILAGVLVSTAVLTGALIVGDSVRYSLERISVQRLGMIRFAVAPGERLFRQDLAREIAGKGSVRVSPILQTGAIAISNENNARINRVTVTGINEDFPGFWKTEQPGETGESNTTGYTRLAPAENEAVLSSNAASRLGVKPGDDILLRLRLVEKASPNAPFVPDRSDPVALRLKVKAIVGDDAMGRFSLRNEQSSPFNVFVNLGQLARRLRLEGLANGMLVAGMVENPRVFPEPEISGKLLDSLVNICWQPADAGLQIRPLDETGHYDLVSDQIFLSEQQSQAIGTAIPGASPILTYMVNTISANNRATPYSFVTAADPGLLPESPGPREIIINQWLADDLGAGPGDLVKLTYWVMGPMRTLREESTRFIVKTVIPVTKVPSAPRLMPDFPGMSDAGNCRDWETGSPVDLSKIRDKDEQYWTDFRGTPKAFIALGTGQHLWANAFGTVTAFRFQANPADLPEITNNLMRRLVPSGNGFLFRPVYDEGSVAASHSTDFGQLFLGLSFFIIAAALLLTALLFSLHVTGRIEEAGTLIAIGFRRTAIIRILMGEAMSVAVGGSIAGALAGILINSLLLAGLNTLWYDAVQTTSLVAFIKPATLATGALTGLITAAAVMALALRRKLRIPAAQLVKGVPGAPRKTGLRRPRNLVAVVLLALGTFAVIVTGANRKSFPDEMGPSSGTGGFLLWTESTLPILKNLNSAAGRKDFFLEDDTLFRKVSFIPLQRLEGDDASCLNLNQVARPPLLAVPAGLFDSLGLFSFAALDRSVDAGHPWKSLPGDTTGNVIKGFADMTVIIWGLQKKIGDTLRYMDEKGNELLIRIAGGLENSVFQGHLLIDGTQFRRLFPSVSGARLILVNGPGKTRDSIARQLEERFRDYGMMAIPASEKLASFNAVENTYLTVFMMLGGLGMVIGTIGLGIILWRNIRERRRELALLRALGYSQRLILGRLFSEYLRILLTGMGAGVIASMLVLFPNFLRPGYHFPTAWVVSILALILLSGLAWIWFPARRAMNNQIIEGLRDE
jgi:ABC-type antimicrobial peptide transport system permease subunit